MADAGTFQNLISAAVLYLEAVQMGTGSGHLYGSKTSAVIHNLGSE